MRTVWASINPTSSGETFLEGSIQHTVTHEVMIRYQQGIDFHSGVRLVYDSRYFKVLGAQTEDEIKQFTTLSVVEGVAT